VCWPVYVYCRELSHLVAVVCHCAVFTHLLLLYSRYLFRNYDILAAVFTDVLQFMHEDLNIV
jgi:hypothetical protein